MSEEFVYGKNSVEALIKNSDRSINKIYLVSSARQDNKTSYISKLAKENKIPVTSISKDKVYKLIGNEANHQGVIASVSPVNYAELDDIIEKIKNKSEPALLVLLDNIEDPQNLGSIIRSSEVLGVDAVIIPKRRSAIVTGTVSKTSSGATELIPIARINNLVNTMNELKDNGVWIIGAEFEHKSQFLQKTDLTMPCAIVMGSEGKGLSRLVKQNCDLLVKIPQFGKTNSLNVANALSIILYEVVRQRSQ